MLANLKFLQTTKNLNKFFKKFSQKFAYVKLGDLGEGTKEATVKRWYKQVGDKVEEVIF